MEMVVLRGVANSTHLKYLRPAGYRIVDSCLELYFREVQLFGLLEPNLSDRYNYDTYTYEVYSDRVVESHVQYIQSINIVSTNFMYVLYI